MSLNNVTLLGNLTRDPDVRNVGTNSTVCDFSIAMNRNRKNQDGEKITETTFVDINCWQKTAELCGKFLKKGDRVAITGRLQQDRWEDKEGNKRSKLYVTAHEVEFLTPPSERDERSQSDNEDDLGEL